MVGYADYVIQRHWQYIICKALRQNLIKNLILFSSNTGICPVGSGLVIDLDGVYRSCGSGFRLVGSDPKPNLKQTLKKTQLWIQPL